MGKPKEEEKTIIELDDDEEMDFADEVEIDDDDTADDSVVDDDDDDIQSIINAAVLKAKKQSMAYTDKRMERVNEKLAKHSKAINTHTEQIENLEKVVQAMAKGKVAVVGEAGAVKEKKNVNIIDKTLGTVGGVAHTIVDTAAFLCESAVDLVTLGRAKRPQ